MTRTLLALAAGLTAVTAEVPICDDGEVRDVEIMFSSVEYIKSFEIYLTGDATGGNGAEIMLLPPTAAVNDETATDTPKFQVDLVQSEDGPTEGRYYYSGVVTDGPCDGSENSGCLQPTDLINPPDGGPTIENLLTVPVCFLSGGDQPGPAACVDVEFNEGTEGPGPTEFVAASGEITTSRILEQGGNAVESDRCRTLEVGVYEDAQPDTPKSEEGEKERGGDDVDDGGGDDDNDDDDDDLPRPA